MGAALADWLLVAMVGFLVAVEVFHMTHPDHKKCDCHEELEQIKVELANIGAILSKLTDLIAHPLPSGGTIKQLE